MKILYYGVTAYHFLCFVLHKHFYRQNDKAVLLIPERINESRSFQKYFSDAGVFEQVFLYDEPSVSKDKSLKENLSHIKEFYDNDLPIEIGFFDEIYVAVDHYAFGAYLVINSLKYNYFEDASGRLSRHKELAKDVCYVNPARGAIAEALGLYGNSLLVDNRYGDLALQDSDYLNQKDIHFSVTELLSQLNRTEIRKLANLFLFRHEDSGFESFEVKNSTILLTQHYINLNMMRYEEQKLMYQLLVDYFAGEKKLFIKPHPSDIHGLYANWFPGATMLPRLLPSEFLPFILEEINTVLVASSTSTLALEKNVKNSIRIGCGIEKNYSMIHKYYVVVSYLLSIKNDLRYVFIGDASQGLMKELIKTFPPLSYQEEITGKSELTATIIGKITEDNRNDIVSQFLSSSQDSFFIFLNYDNGCSFFEHSMKGYLVPIQITLSHQEGIFNKKKSEYIYLLSKNSLLREVAMKMKDKIELTYSGITVEINQEDKSAIGALEGINAAIERRLLEVQGQYDELYSKHRNRD
ncbi:MAG: hypothetical protein FWG23_01520 [Eggerthellaceae bacterium]|nr:hypothetical protein [Eggerthellaceae bacterium]